MLPLLATVLIVGLGAVIGVGPVRKLVEIHEARHELKQGSAGFIRMSSGWIVIVLWLVAVWFCATITGDWWATGDFEGALHRSGRRLQVLLRILNELSSD